MISVSQNQSLLQHEARLCDDFHKSEVILVQVNPGEAFTIRREDGQFQCITGPAQVPMMSPNGSVPPIYVPPGYVSQVLFFLPVSADSHPQHGRPLFVHRDDRTSKTHERLQKKLKERQGGGGGGCGQVKDSPPSSPQKSCGSPPTTDIHNGVGGKVLETEQQGQLRHTVVSSDKQTAKGKNGESLELDKEAQAMQALLSTISKPEVSDIQARGAVVKWSGPTRPEGESSINVEDKPNPLSYEVSISISGNDGNYQSVHSGEELSATLQDLRPATDYHVRVRALCNCLQGSPSEAASFTTLSCEPDLPNPPRKTSGTKNTLVLQWKVKIKKGSVVLTWNCSYINTRKNKGVPLPPLPPELEVAGVTWLCLKWQRPSSSPKEDDINYVLEMEEDGLGYGFQPSYDGDELTFTVRSLHRSTKYKFRVAAYNSEGKSNPSPVVEFITHPDRPSSPCRPVIRGRVLPHSFKMVWEPPKDDGGAEVTKYVVELSEGLSGVSWGLAYSGSAMDHVCDGLKPGCTYQTRVYCISEGGQSPLSETLQVQTPAVPPGPCQPPRLAGKPKAREVQLRWAPPQVDGGSPVSSYSLEASEPQCEESREVYQGPDMDCSVGGLMPGRTYCFRLKAANKAGFGPLSERCEVTTGPGAPEQCRIPSTTCKSPTCVVVSWESPQCNGAPVTEFRLEWGAVEGSMQVCYSGPAFSHEMKGLLPATSYFCRVQAVNVAGVGPFSDAVHCQTPCSVPAGVSSIYILKEAELRGTRPAPMYSPSTCLGICWDPPCDHGSPITSYLIDLGERQPIVVGPVTKHVIQHLQPDTSYRIRIQALNSLGAGPFSHTFKMKTKPLPPPPPRLECTAFSHQTLRLKWGDGPTKSASSDALQYQLQMGDRNGRFISMYKGPCHIHKVQRLNESTSYTFRIQAFNEAGEGPFSSVYTFTTPRSPPAPVKAPKVERLDDNSCEVTWEALPPMKGDPVIYTLQSMMGNSEFKQAYKGSSTSFHIHNLQPNSDYRFRVCAIRQCQDAPELSGPYSPTVTLSPQRVDATPGGASAAALASRTGAESSRSRQSLTDEQCAFLLLMVFAVIAILIAFVIQYFVIK
uniref:Fibronectin type-III domain-containing protein 3A n=1 Tax=Gouania willdenowi TaxID=441366 RepID=A0A8C5E9P0_GOUWI